MAGKKIVGIGLMLVLFGTIGFDGSFAQTSKGGSAYSVDPELCALMLRKGKESFSRAHYTEAKELLRKIWEWWDENGRSRERVAELIERMGLKTFLRAIDIKPSPQMVFRPRSNPYVFFD